ncbi:hypothetical protein ACQPYA_15915 [Micromonospora sp. CA-263727]|uniref:hypothetical protein n=1 Tax=Micromonospora sp. CA-263727 TaxID=3239967 RepID=UPI003D9469AB
MSTTLDGRALGRTHYATRAVLERSLAPLGLTFPQALLLNALAGAVGPLPRDEAAAGLVQALKVAGPAAQATLTELVAAQLVAPLPEDPGTVTLTPAGRRLQRRVAGVSGEIGARLWADLPAGDLAVAARVLEVVRRRAEAELAA